MLREEHKLVGMGMAINKYELLLLSHFERRNEVWSHIWTILTWEHIKARRKWGRTRSCMRASKQVTNILRSLLLSRNMEQGSDIGTENRSQVYNAQKGWLTSPMSHIRLKTQWKEEFEFPNSHSIPSKYLHDMIIIYIYGILFDNFPNILTCIVLFSVIINE